MAHEENVEVAKIDLQLAWAVLENLAVSLDQIGDKFGGEQSRANGAECSRGLQEALATYLTPELVKAINDARIRLGRYISDEEAEAIAGHIGYWDGATACRVPGKTRYSA
jgi:hypothetical protein